MRTKEQPGDFEARQQHLFREEDKNKGLSSREITFCYEYVANKGNGVAAAMAAGCRAKGPAGVRAFKWLKRAKIQKKIKEISSDHFKGLKVRAEDILNELTTLGFSDLKHCITWGEDGLTHIKSSEDIGDDTRAIREITVEERYVPGTKKAIVERNISIKMHPKKDALELLLKVKHPDLFKSDKEGETPIGLNVHVDAKDIQGQDAAKLARSYFELRKVLQAGSGMPV